MTDFIHWRGRARIVGYFDLIVSIVLLLIVAIIGIAIGVQISNSDEKKTNDSEAAEVTNSPSNLDRDQKILIGKIVLVTLFAFLTTHLLFQLWFSLKLLKATKIGADSDKAFELAKAWRTANIVFIVVTLIEIGIIGFLTGLTTRFFIGMFAVILLRLGFVAIVHLFVEEL